jgi:hypothetical protein
MAELLKLAETLHPVLNDEIRRIFDSSMDILARKLNLAVGQIQQLQDPSSPAQPGSLGFRRGARGAHYAVYRSALDATIRDLEGWQVRFKMALDLSMRDRNPAIDQTLQRVRETQLAEERAPMASSSSTLTLTGSIRDALRPTGAPPSVFLPAATLETSTIPFSRASVACMESSSPSNPRWFVLDTLPCRPGTDLRAVGNDVRGLARKLRRADPFAFGLLSCKGAMRVPGPPAATGLSGFDLVFNVPAGADAKQLQSLRARLLLPARAPSLSRRVRLAQELATSVSYVHTFDFVHKNICPESVLLLREEEQGARVDASAVATAARRSSFLIGFESFRSAAGNTSLAGDGDWAHNIYRHPERMGEFPAEAYRMQHDIYSLGVCLLEIGFWEPLVEYAGGDAASSKPDYGRVCRDFVRTDKHWVFFKDYLVSLAEEELPGRMGDRYTDVVVTCLTCLDKESDFGEQVEGTDEDGILVGVRFIETIFGRLKEIEL